MEEKVRNFYNELASNYDLEQEEFGFIRLPEREIAFKAIENVVDKKHKVLELGAGTGRFTLELASLAKEVTAIDVSPNMLDLLNKKAKTRGITNIRTICSDIMETTVDETFDVIVSFSAIEYILDKNALFAKISKCLAPGGHLIITTAHNTFFRWWGRMGNYLRQGILMNAYSKKQMNWLLESNGLEALEISDLCLKSLLSKGVLLFVHATKKV